jgi:hypothetical protein
MKFGGHETFPVREGWLRKGLVLLDDHPSLQTDPHVCDYLGVGRNMAKSIWHWLKITGLVESRTGTSPAPLVLSDLGRCVLKRDPYLLETATWWALHTNVVSHANHALVWRWFFNEFAIERFDRALCMEQLHRKLETSGARMPSAKTLVRDIHCLLQSYARPIPAETEDPEDANESPFRELGLLVHHRDAGTFSLQRGVKNVPPEILGYVISRSGFAQARQGQMRVPVKDVLSAPGMPGRVLGLSGDALAALLHQAEAALGNSVLSVRAFGGEKVLEMTVRSDTEWLAGFYDRVGHR